MDPEPLLSVVQDHYPYPVAQAARRLREAGSARERLKAAFDLGSALIILLGSVSLAWCQREGVVPPGVGRWYEAFERRRPSLEGWLDAIRDGAHEAYRNSAVLSGYSEALAVEPRELLQDLDALAQARDRHDAGYYRRQGDTAPPAAQRDYEANLYRALERSGFLQEMRFVLIQSMDWRRRTGQFIKHVHAVHGSRVLRLTDQSGTERFESLEPFEARALYLLRSGEGSDLNMTPFWTYRPCQQASCTDAHFFYLDRRTRDRAFESIAFEIEHRYVDTEAPDDYPNFGQPAETVELAPETIRMLRGPRSGPTDISRDRIDLPALYQKTEESLIKSLRVQRMDHDEPEEPDEDRKEEVDGQRNMGWNHHLDLPSMTPVATAYGLRIMAIVTSEYSGFDTDAVGQTLWRMRLKDGCWSASSQGLIGRPEPTAHALTALWVSGATAGARAREALRSFHRLLTRPSNEALWHHVYSLTTVIRTLVAVTPRNQLESKLVQDLVGQLRRGEVHVGDSMYWTPVVDRPDGATSQASAVHTAHTLLTLVHCYRATEGQLGPSPEELQPAVRWLLREAPWDNQEEEILYTVEEDRYHFDRLWVRHFTSAWVVLALLELGADPGEERIRSAVNMIYLSHTDGLWSWGPSSAKPIWATYDALRALRAYAYRASEV